MVKRGGRFTFKPQNGENVDVNIDLGPGEYVIGTPGDSNDGALLHVTDSEGHGYTWVNKKGVLEKNQVNFSQAQIAPLFRPTAQ